MYKIINARPVIRLFSLVIKSHIRIHRQVILGETHKYLTAPDL